MDSFIGLHWLLSPYHHLLPPLPADTACRYLHPIQKVMTAFLAGNVGMSGEYAVEAFGSLPVIDLIADTGGTQEENVSSMERNGDAQLL